jgi:hypothetical protein
MTLEMGLLSSDLIAFSDPLNLREFLELIRSARINSVNACCRKSQTFDLEIADEGQYDVVCNGIKSKRTI